MYIWIKESRIRPLCLTNVPSVQRSKNTKPINEPQCVRTYCDLKILSLNCCGVKKKLNYSEFQELVKEQDIVCLQETKTDDLDVIEIDGYEIKMKNRVKYGRVNSGGIILAYKQELSEFINIHETESKAVLWFEISKQLTNYEKNLLIGIVYLPPENSKYSKRDSLNMI